MLCESSSKIKAVSTDEIAACYSSVSGISGGPICLRKDYTKFIGSNHRGQAIPEHKNYAKGGYKQNKGNKRLRGKSKKAFKCTHGKYLSDALQKSTNHALQNRRIS
eukprot:TRINITY_DN7707_c0_g2_i1.p1 TRINITY_DN7707_c0_g2~~TRINITY_DN7707_c0_g2_i1.p1  ORF type:complete len:106 (-),score=4.08 TRINITY_DN7707_c0_g2_i1:11-328(-)